MPYVHTVEYINPTQDDCKGQLFPWRLLRYAEFDTQHPANATVRTVKAGEGREPGRFQVTWQTAQA